MSKHIYKVLVLTLLMTGIILIPTFASDISEQIENAMCITEYEDDTKFNDFDTVTFGEYPQSNENGNIERNDGAPEPIEWFVLEKQGNKALLLSKYIMGEIQKKGNYEVTSWNNSFLKKFLNNTFKNKAFNSNEQKNIIDINNNGYVFVPSYEELVKYFGIDQQRTNNDLNNKIVFSSKASYSMYKSNEYLLSSYCLRNIDNKYNSFYITSPWLESRDIPLERYCISKNDPGYIGLDSQGEHNWFEKGIRPAIWVSLSDNGNQNSHNTNNVASQQNNTGKNSNTIAGLPSVQSEYRDDGHFYLNNNMQKSTWIYYVTYYYHVDGAGNIEKSKWIEQRYVGADGRMYRGRQTPDGKWVGDDGLVVNVSQDLSNSLTIEAAEPDSWYKTQSGLWYYFENDRTTTKKGWFTDARDNQTYYLDPSTGIMAVGWTTINGSEYYFNESHDNVNNWYETGGGFYESYGKKTKAYGSMFRNEKTPDGHQVDGNGKMIN